MKYRTLKRANLSVSEIGLGCMSLEEDHAQNERILRSAYEGGINLFDTADIYQNGFNEESAGKALKPFRKKVIIATKVGNVPNTEGNGLIWNPSKSHILKSVEGSLKRLKTDYIDIYQLHGGTIEDNWEETTEAFEQLKQEGKIRHYGLSSIRPNVIKRFAKQTNIVSDMLQYNLLDRRAEEEVLGMLEEQGVGVLVRGVLAKGVLAQKNRSVNLDNNKEPIDILIDKMKSFSIEKNTISQLAIQWVLSYSSVTSALVGVRTLDQLKDVLGVHDLPEMTHEVYRELSNIIPVERYTNHR